MVNVSFLKAGEEVQLGFAIFAVYSRADEKPCSKSPSRYDCRQMCYIRESIRWFIELCHCYQLVFASAYLSTEGLRMCPHVDGKTSVEAGFIDYLASCTKTNVSYERR